MLGDLIRGLVEVGGELPDGAEVSLLGALGEAGQLEVLVHALAKRGAHEWVLSKRREEKPSGNPLCHGHRRVSPGPRRPSTKARGRELCPSQERVGIIGRAPAPDEAAGTKAVSTAEEAGDPPAAKRLT